MFALTQELILRFPVTDEHISLTAPPVTCLLTLCWLFVDPEMLSVLGGLGKPLSLSLSQVSHCPSSLCPHRVPLLIAWKETVPFPRSRSLPTYSLLFPSAFSFCIKLALLARTNAPSTHLFSSHHLGLPVQVHHLKPTVMLTFSSFFNSS